MSELNKYTLSNINWLTNDLVILNFSDYDHSFVAGEHVTLSTLNGYEAREYSIYSGQYEKGISLLVKIVEDGFFTPRLRTMQKGDLMVISRPHGSFLFNKTTEKTGKHWFISTGTGIAPINSIVTSNKISQYVIVHGVRYLNDAVISKHFPSEKLQICISRDKNKSKFKRVTEYMKMQRFTEFDCFYLCGNGSMVYDCKNLLRDMNVLPHNIFTEVYF